MKKIFRRGYNGGRPAQSGLFSRASIMSKCLNDIDLERYAAGELPSGQHDVAAGHLQDCPTCQGRYAAFLDGHDQMLNQLRGLAGVSGDLLKGPRRVEASPPPPVRIPARTGMEIEGYEIQGEIHRGGQGVVYRALQRGTRRDVAIKVLLEGAAASSATKKRFMREVDLIAQLRHPGIITIFESGLTNDGRQFYVMDYVAGLPLDAFVRQNQLTMPVVLALFEHICHAVHYAHQRGIIHRDLKPSNILVDGDGAARVLDFGLAKQVTDQLQTQVSMTGQVFGTLPYMSPEQATGKQDSVDARTDVYALGVLLFELLTGTYPYPVTGSITEVLRNIAESPPLRPSRAWEAGKGIAPKSITKSRVSVSPIDEEVETIILKCLAKEPERRYQTAAALADDLASYCAGGPIDAKRDSRWYVIKKSIPRYKASIAVLAALLVTVAGIVGLKIQRDRMNVRLASERAAQRDMLVTQCRDAVMLLDANRIQELLKRADELELDQGLVHCYRGYAHLIRLERAAAQAEAVQAITVNPKHAESLFLLAGVKAYQRDMLGALNHFQEGLKHSTGAPLELALQGILKSLLGQYDAALADLDLLVARQHGSAAVLFVRGFARWLRILHNPMLDLSERRRVGELALADLNASASLYPHVPFMFDVRHDVHSRLAAIHAAQGDMVRSEEYVEAMLRDADEVERLGALGNAGVIRADAAARRGNYNESARLAENAYNELRKPNTVASVNHKDALETSIGQWLIALFAAGRDEDARLTCERLKKENPEGTAPYIIGFIEGMYGDAEELRGWIRAGKCDGDPFRSLYSWGLWVSLAARGEGPLAHELAERLSVSLMERFQFSGTFVSYVQGRSSDSELLAAAGDHANRALSARLASALNQRDRKGKLKALREVKKIGHPSFTNYLAVALAYRADHDKQFLDKPFSVRPARTKP